MKRQIIVVTSLLPLLILASCVTSPESAGWPKLTYAIAHSYERSNLEDASELVGWDAPVPVPTYLPEGCEIREVIVKGTGLGARVYIIISDEEIEWVDNEFSAVMVIQVAYNPRGVPPIKLIPKLQDLGDQYALPWQVTFPSTHGLPTHELILSASKDMPEEELFKVRDGTQF